MLKRILYHFKKSGAHIVLTFVIYTFVLFFFCVSLLITNIGDMQKYLFSDNLDLYVSLGSSLQLFLNGTNNISPEELASQNKVTLAAYDQLKATKGVTWSCLEQKTNISSGVMTMDYQTGTDNPDIVAPYYKDIADYEDMRDLWKTLQLSYSLLCGTSTGNFSELQLNQYSIAEGRTFTEDEITSGSDVCLLVGDFVIFHKEEDGTITKSKLSVGDTIPISIVDLNENGEILAKHVTDLRIIGMMKVNNERSQMNYRVYLPIQTFQKIEDIYQNTAKITSPDQLYVSESPIFRVDTVEHLNDLIQNIERMEKYQNGFFSYYATTDQYTLLLADIFTTVSGFNIIAKVCILIVIVVAIAVALINLRFRQKENAILYAMGTEKRKLALQNFLENLIMLIPSLCISIPLSLYSSRRVTTAIFSQHTESTIAETMAEELQGAAIVPTSEEISLFIRFSNLQWLSVILLVCLVLFISWFMSMCDSKKMNVRELLS